MTIVDVMGRQPLSHGLSSYRPLERARREGGKMRNPGNEVEREGGRKCSGNKANEASWDGALGISVASSDSRGRRSQSISLLFMFLRKIVMRSLVLEKEI